MLYKRYASPKDFLRLYMDDGRFGEFVYEIISSENKRKQDEAEKEEDRKLWELYLHSASDKSFLDWKKEVVGRKKTTAKHDADLTNDDVDTIIKRLFPNA